MSWFSDTEKRWQAERERIARIEEQATAIYEALWAKILSILKEAKTADRFANIETNGRPDAHTITLNADDDPDAPWTIPPVIEITLKESEHRIDAVGTTAGIDIRFDFDVCAEDHHVCLKFEGREVSYEAAAARILTALLYPGLPYAERAASWKVL